MRHRSFWSKPATPRVVFKPTDDPCDPKVQASGELGPVLGESLSTPTLERSRLKSLLLRRSRSTACL